MHARTHAGAQTHTDVHIRAHSNMQVGAKQIKMVRIVKIVRIVRYMYVCMYVGMYVHTKTYTPR